VQISLGVVSVLSCTWIPYGMTIIVKDISILRCTMIFIVVLIFRYSDIIIGFIIIIPMVFPTKLRLIIIMTYCLGVQRG
jgi:hypothetical protein